MMPCLSAQSVDKRKGTLDFVQIQEASTQFVKVPFARVPASGRPRFWLLVPASLVLVGGVLSGCGSGSTTPSAAVSSVTGRATVNLVWPDQVTSRLIPVASNSITVAFFNGTTQVAVQTVARPASGNTTTLNFATLPAGSLTLAAAAYPTTDGTGTSQASASVAATIVANTTVNLTVTMLSNIASISVTPSATSVAVGSMVTLTATPLNASGATVLAPNTLAFASSNTAVATVTSSGVVTGVTAGNATITVTETESGKTATATVGVTAASSGSTGGATVTVN